MRFDAFFFGPILAYFDVQGFCSEGKDFHFKSASSLGFPHFFFAHIRGRCTVLALKQKTAPETKSSGQNCSTLAQDRSHRKRTSSFHDLSFFSLFEFLGFEI
jgi:hypothetical protein